MGPGDYSREIGRRGYIRTPRDQVTLNTLIVIRGRHCEPSSQSSAIQSFDTHLADLA
jgi:hypothetical protein